MNNGSQFLFVFFVSKIIIELSHLSPHWWTMSNSSTLKSVGVSSLQFLVGCARQQSYRVSIVGTAHYYYSSRLFFFLFFLP